MVIWLEDRKIREYEIEQRINLRTDSPLWDACFGEVRLFELNGFIKCYVFHIIQYLKAIGCPFVWNFSAPDVVLTWLLSYAISLEYADMCESCQQENENITSYSNQLEDKQLTMQAQPDITSVEDNMDQLVIEKGDGNSDSLVEEVRQLAEILHVPIPDASVSTNNDSFPILQILQECNKIIRLYYTSTSTSNSDTNDSKAMTTTNKNNNRDIQALELLPLGFDTGDVIVNQLSKILKMLYLFDFRELQDDVNNLIILGQEYTANP